MHDSITVGFISLGCAKNLVDSQVMASALLQEGLSLAPSPEEADIVLVNTCAFIEEAREESIDAILSATRLKTSGRCRGVIVAGCLPQRYRADLKTSLPEVDAFVGLDRLDRVAAVARRIMARTQRIFEVPDEARRLFEPRGPAVVFTGGPYAYLKIAEGCNHRCTFCAIPAIRGRYRSRPIRRIVAEAEQLLGAGIRELNLISQDCTAFGRDRGRRNELVALLRALAKIGGRFWIRLLYGYPSGVTPALLETIAACPQVCRYLDVPVQHSHPDILRGMRRAATVPAVQGLAARARRVMPGVALRTTCLVGFPGEQDTHFRHLLRYVQATAFDHLGAFTYSPEEGTAAEAMPRRPTHGTAERRRQRLLAAQRDVVETRAAALRGTEDDVLLERKTGRRWIGRTRRQAPEVDGVTFVTGVPAGARPGDFLRVRYTGHADYDLRAKAL